MEIFHFVDHQSDLEHFLKLMLNKGERIKQHIYEMDKLGLSWSRHGAWQYYMVICYVSYSDAFSISFLSPDWMQLFALITHCKLNTELRLQYLSTLPMEVQC